MSIEIVVKTINNESYRYTLAPNTLVHELKAEVKGSTSIPSERQRLIYRGQVMEDGNSLESYRIESGHTVHMVARPVNATPSPTQRASPALTAGIAPDSMSGIAQHQQQQQLRDVSRMGLQDPAIAFLGPFSGLSEAFLGGSNIMRSEQIVPPRQEPSMEHVRQSLLSLHSLRAATPISLLTGNRYLAADPTMHRDRRKVFYTGQWMDVKDTVNQWLEATVMRVDNVERKVYVHYNGWPTRWDEWISFDSPRISPFRTRTVHTGVTGLMCPSPNTIASFAPNTGRDDVRQLLPAMLDMYDLIGPMLREAVALSKESLEEEPNVFDVTPPLLNGAVAASPELMPWDRLGSDQEIPRRRDIDRDPVTSSTTRLVEHLHYMLPLFDRFGRAMCDIAPHLNLKHTPRASDNEGGDISNQSSTTPNHQSAIIEPALVTPGRSVMSSLRPPLASTPQHSRASNHISQDQRAGRHFNDSEDGELFLPNNAQLGLFDLPLALRHLLQPRPPSPPPERAYTQVINSAPQRVNGQSGGSGINHLVDIHIHAILTPPRSTTVAPAAVNSGPVLESIREGEMLTSNSSANNSLIDRNDSLTVLSTVEPPANQPSNLNIMSDNDPLINSPDAEICDGAMTRAQDQVSAGVNSLLPFSFRQEDGMTCQLLSGSSDASVEKIGISEILDSSPSFRIYDSDSLKDRIKISEMMNDESELNEDVRNDTLGENDRERAAAERRCRNNDDVSISEASLHAVERRIRELEAVRSHAHTSNSTARQTNIKSPDRVPKNFQFSDNRKRSHIDKDIDEREIVSLPLNNDQDINFPDLNLEVEQPIEALDAEYDRTSTLKVAARDESPTKVDVEDAQNENVKSRRNSLLDRLRDVVSLGSGKSNGKPKPKPSDHR